MKNILPPSLYEKIAANVMLNNLSEIRIRKDKPILICNNGNYEILQERKGFAVESVIADSQLISQIVAAATKHSFYAYNNQIRQGFITTDNGIRIGLCGTVVFHEDKVATIKDITSLNIRIAHKVTGCSSKIIDLICGRGNIKNTLIISPPGAGKTTIVRDVAEKLSCEKKINNILLVDERFELAGLGNVLISAPTVDVMAGCEKSYALKEGIKVMNPGVIILDEIGEAEELKMIEQTAKSGVKVIATAHANNIADLKTKSNFVGLIENKIFERIVILSKRQGFGTIEAVFDETLKAIFVQGLT